MLENLPIEHKCCRYLLVLPEDEITIEEASELGLLFITPSTFELETDLDPIEVSRKYFYLLGERQLYVYEILNSKVYY